jgi:hypothetical protein
MKIRPGFSMRTDGLKEGQTDMTKVTVTFRNYANAPNNSLRCTASSASLALFLDKFGHWVCSAPK